MKKAIAIIAALAASTAAQAAHNDFDQSLAFKLRVLPLWNGRQPKDSSRFGVLFTAAVVVKI
jgi:hypothetical protein